MASHLVFARPLCHPQMIICFKVVLDCDVKVTLLLLIWFTRQGASNLLALFNRQDFPQIKNCLLPMCISCMWASCKFYGLVACSEVDIKPGNEGMNEVAPAAIQDEWSLESQIRRGDGVKIDHEHCRGIGNTSLHFDGINKGFR